MGVKALNFKTSFIKTGSRSRFFQADQHFISYTKAEKVHCQF